jgi:hypothetical protein
MNNDLELMQTNFIINLKELLESQEKVIKKKERKKKIKIIF